MKITYTHSSLGLQPDKNPVIDEDLSSFSVIPEDASVIDDDLASFNVAQDKEPVIDEDLTSFKQSATSLALIIVAAVAAVSAIIYGISRLFKGGKK